MVGESHVHSTSAESYTPDTAFIDMAGYFFSK
jgi:hypothetical protein